MVNLCLTEIKTNPFAVGQGIRTRHNNKAGMDDLGSPAECLPGASGVTPLRKGGPATSSGTVTAMNQWVGDLVSRASGGRMETELHDGVNLLYPKHRWCEWIARFRDREGNRAARINAYSRDYS